MTEFSLCLNTSTVRTTPLLKTLELAGRSGFRAVELWHDEVSAYLEQGGTPAELRKAMGDAGLAVVSMIALFGWATVSADDYPRILDECKRRMDLAAEVGSPYIIASPPDEVVDLFHAAARFGELFKLGRAAGVEPSMEFLGFVRGINTVASAWTVARDCGEPDATVVADVFHMIRGGGSVDDLLTLQGDRLAVFHINDLPARPDPRVQADSDRVMPGDGIADLPRVIRNLRAIGYRGPLSLELFNPGLWARNPAEVLKVGIERLRALVNSESD